MRRYKTSACGHELSGRVRAHANTNYYAWDECAWVASKLLITPLSELGHNIIILQVYMV